MTFLEPTVKSPKTEPPRPVYVENLLDLDEKQRDSLPVSFDAEGNVLSVYRDNVWKFYPYIAPKNVSNSLKRIDYSSPNFFPDGSSLTDPQHEGLLNSSKEFFYILSLIHI